MSEAVAAGEAEQKMIWVGRIIALINGFIFAYWSEIGSDNPNWHLWAKFMAVATLGYSAGYFCSTRKPKEKLK